VFALTTLGGWARPAIRTLSRGRLRNPEAVQLLIITELSFVTPLADLLKFVVNADYRLSLPLKQPDLSIVAESSLQVGISGGPGSS